MKRSSSIKFLLCDESSLDTYISGKLPDFSDIKRQMFLHDRDTNKNIPDHYYKLNEEYTFNGIETLSEILTKGLYRIADDYLELRGKRIYVKANKQNEWQEVLTYIPPLILIAAFLSVSKKVDIKSMEDMDKFYDDYILPNTRHTALPFPYLPQLETYVKENKGFYDLHMHLNGSTETDITWQDFLYEPDEVQSDIINGYKNKLAREQYEQESHLRTPLQYYNLLKSAQCLRDYFHKVIFPSKNKVQDQSERKYGGLLEEVNSGVKSDTILDSIYHPFYEAMYQSPDNESYERQRLLSIECLMYVYLLKYVSKNQREDIAGLFHYYLLILGFTNRMLVQQKHQYGFIQFKKLTVNELREKSEYEYKSRFFQLQGNDLRNLNFLEGRFSPKNDEKKQTELLNRINDGWEKLVNNIDITTQPKLKLLAHFIKEPDDKESDEIRFRTLRCSLWKKACVLAIMKENNPPEMKNVVGIDAASSEFDTPPEVFAPTFRMLRRKGYKHFTYHAGEDFFHILSGLRAIFEAVEFNELQCGDRIGHATATGLSPQLWKENIGSRMLMRRGEYLDDLLFAHYLIISQERDPIAKGLRNQLPFLANRIQELAYGVYGRYYSLKTLEDAWMLRRFCPILTQIIQLESEQHPNDEFYWLQTARGKEIFDEDEYNQIREKTHSIPYRDESVKLYMDYHNKEYRNTYEEIIEINTEDCFTMEELESLQLLVLKHLHNKEIIIETLPTSNVRIGHHSSFGTYHLWNWLRWEAAGNCIPPIVVGTDDTGIFATNIYNEFANIYCFLTHQKEISHTQAMNIITQLERNAKIYRFD